MKTINDNDFYEQFKPVKNHIDTNASWDGCMFETYGEELEFVKAQPEKKIWTVMDSDNGEMMVGSGFHFVNRLGYLITEEPWDDEIQVLDPDIDYDSDEEKCYFCRENPVMRPGEELCQDCYDTETAESEIEE